MREGIQRPDCQIPVDVLAHNNLALCLTYVRNIPKAVDEMKRAVELVPRRALFRTNLALYANYASDFARPPAGESHSGTGQTAVGAVQSRARAVGTRTGSTRPH